MNALTKANLQLWWFGFRYIPLIGFCKPKILELTDARTVIRMPHHRHTKNHLGSIYFGALAIGADLAGAFLVFYKARQKKLNFVPARGERLGQSADHVRQSARLRKRHTFRSSKGYSHDNSPVGAARSKNKLR